jgi:hypothetical protein
MEKYEIIDYSKIELPDELLTSFAEAFAPELRKFYESDEGKTYFDNWLKKHPEYTEDKSAHSTKKGGEV